MIEWAKNELARIDHDEEGIQNHMDAYVLELLETLYNQDHSNFTAAYVLNAFDRLSHFLPLTPLTGEDDEWNELSGGHFQNKRCSMVFKDADGKAYNSEGKIFSKDGGKTWFTNKVSRVYISFPYMPPRHPEKIILNSGERPKGNWITHIDDIYPVDRTEECPFCHAEQRLVGNDDNFCPNCGADMQKDRNEEEENG